MVFLTLVFLIRRSLFSITSHLAAPNPAKMIIQTNPITHPGGSNRYLSEGVPVSDGLIRKMKKFVRRTTDSAKPMFRTRLFLVLSFQVANTAIHPC